MRAGGEHQGRRRAWRRRGVFLLGDVLVVAASAAALGLRFLAARGRERAEKVSYARMVSHLDLVASSSSSSDHVRYFRPLEKLRLGAANPEKTP